jgi:hypothetical protein
MTSITIDRGPIHSTVRRIISARVEGDKVVITSNLVSPDVGSHLMDSISLTREEWNQINTMIGGAL